MSDPKNLSSDRNTKFYISFHLIGDSTYKQEKNMLEEKLNELCGLAELVIDHEDPIGPHDREIVYCIPAPVSDDVEGTTEYFKAIKELFEQTKRHLPSFTQSTEALT